MNNDGAPTPLNQFTQPASLTFGILHLDIGPGIDFEPPHSSPGDNRHDGYYVITVVLARHATNQQSNAYTGIVHLVLAVLQIESKLSPVKAGNQSFASSQDPTVSPRSEAGAEPPKGRRELAGRRQRNTRHNNKATVGPNPGHVQTLASPLIGSAPLGPSPGVLCRWGPGPTSADY